MGAVVAKSKWEETADSYLLKYIAAAQPAVHSQMELRTIRHLLRSVQTWGIASETFKPALT